MAGACACVHVHSDAKAGQEASEVASDVQVWNIRQGRRRCTDGAGGW